MTFAKPSEKTTDAGEIIFSPDNRDEALLESDESSASSLSHIPSPSHHRREKSTDAAEPSDEHSYDLTKTVTAQDNQAGRVTRIQSLTRRHAPESIFTHPLAHTPTAPDVIVDFHGKNDPYHPYNWPIRKKILTTLLYGFTTMGSTFASSVYSPAVNTIAEEFQVSMVVSLLGLSLLLAGFGLGPLLFGPISEIYGRKPAVLTPYFIGAIFCFSTGAAKDIQTILITRFFTGLFASAPVTNTYVLDTSFSMLS